MKLFIFFLLLSGLAFGDGGDLRTRHFKVTEASLRPLKPLDQLKDQLDPFAALGTSGAAPLSLESLMLDQDWNEFLKPLQLESGLPWYDLRPVLELKAIQILEPGSALWNRTTGELLVRAPLKELNEIQFLFSQLTHRDQPLYVGPRPMVTFEARCVSCVVPNDAARKTLLDGIPTMKQLLAGAYGTPVAVAAMATQCEPGARHQAAAAATPGLKEFKMEIKPVIGMDAETVHTELTLNLSLANGAQFSQQCLFEVAHYAPALLELGGTGTAEDPAYFLILRVAVIK